MWCVVCGVDVCVCVSSRVVKIVAFFLFFSFLLERMETMDGNSAGDL